MLKGEHPASVEDQDSVVGSIQMLGSASDVVLSGFLTVSSAVCTNECTVLVVMRLV